MKRRVPLLALGHLSADFTQGALPALLPALLVANHLSLAHAATLILVTNLTSSLTQPLLGLLADRTPCLCWPPSASPWRR